MSPIDTSPPAPVVLGEVLFDRFPNGREVLGGAPFNVAWHLQGMGLNPDLVTRIGADPQGRKIEKAMAAWGLSTRYLQRDAERRTGRVEVETDGIETVFTISPDQAFDHIAVPAVEALPAGGWILYHGTLAWRSAEDDPLSDLRSRSAGVFFDVNLRDPWWERDRVLRMISTATWVKMNDDEMSRLLGDADPALFCRQYDLDALIVTLGARGAEWLTAEGPVAFSAPPAISDLVDTVGAGDAFSAVCLAGLISGWRPERILSRAVEFAADVCRGQGATTRDGELYDRSWPTLDRDIVKEDE